MILAAGFFPSVPAPANGSTSLPHKAMQGHTPHLMQSDARFDRHNPHRMIFDASSEQAHHGLSIRLFVLEQFLQHILSQS
jgi:hypothetical protein